jgi:hypothetical protein
VDEAKAWRLWVSLPADSRETRSPRARALASCATFTGSSRWTGRRRVSRASGHLRHNQLMTELADLRAKFEQDKAKVAEMQRSKRFKPY